MSWDEASGSLLNLDDVDESGGDYPVVPAGDYGFVVDEARFEQSKSGNDMITLKLQLDGNDDEEVDGVTLFHRLTWHDPKGFGLKRLKKTVLALAPDTSLASFNPRQAGEIFTGARGRAKVKVGTWENNPSNEVKEIYADAGSAMF